MSEEMVIRYCAPTLASLKTGSLFSCRFASCDDMHSSVRELNRRLSSKGLRALPMRYGDGRGLVYLFRPGRLRRDLLDETASTLLRERGYSCENPNLCLMRLMERIRQEADFPHEIGLFLGYPPEDVYGFIHARHGAKCCGCWKVYGDVEAARRTFERYRKCTDVYLRCWAEGRDMERLAVSAG